MNINGRLSNDIDSTADLSGGDEDAKAALPLARRRSWRAWFRAELPVVDLHQQLQVLISMGVLQIQAQSFAVW